MKYKRNSIEYALAKKDVALLAAVSSKKWKSFNLEENSRLIINLCKKPISNRNTYSEIIKILQCIIKNGMDLSKIKYNGKTCVMLSAQWSLEITEFLIKNGSADIINDQDRSGHTVLYHAAVGTTSNSLSIVKLLLENNANPDISLCETLANTQNSNIVAMLLQSAAPENVSENIDKLLLRAVENYNCEVAEYLLEHITFSKKRMVIALECLGFTAVFNEDFNKAHLYWRKSLELRNCQTEPLPKPKCNPCSSHVECGNITELNELFSRHKVSILYEAVLQMERYKYCKLEEIFICFSNLQDIGQSFEESLDLLEYLITNYGKHPAFMNKNIFSCIIEVLVALRKNSTNSQELPILQFSEVFNIVEIMANQLNQWSSNNEKFCGVIMPAFVYFIFLLCSTYKSESEHNQARKLVQFIVKIFSKLKCEDTLLHIATGTYDLKVISMILDCGAFIDGENSSLDTSLYLAIKHRDINIIRLLLTYGAHVDRYCSEGTTLDNLMIQRQDCSSINTFGLIKLQCLCAKTIQQNTIPFKEQNLHISLQQFIKMHG